MNLPLNEHCTIRTYLSEDEVRRRLDAAIEPYKAMRLFAGKHKPYQGEFADGKFQVTRILGYNNSFLPSITGRVGSDVGQTTVDITMGLQPAAATLAIIWLLIMAGAFISAVIRTAGSESITSAISSTTAVVTGFLFVAAVAIVVIAFKAEAAKSRRDFRKMLEDIGAN